MYMNNPIQTSNDKIPKKTGMLLFGLAASKSFCLKKKKNGSHKELNIHQYHEHDVIFSKKKTTMDKK